MGIDLKMRTVLLNKYKIRLNLYENISPIACKMAFKIEIVLPRETAIWATSIPC